MDPVDSSIVRSFTISRKNALLAICFLPTSVEEYEKDIVRLAESSDCPKDRTRQESHIERVLACSTNKQSS